MIDRAHSTSNSNFQLNFSGRARAKNSKSVLIVINDAIEEQELENVMKELLMRKCLEHIQTKNEAQMKSLVRGYATVCSH